MGKLNRELGALQNLNSEQSKKLQSQRELLRRKQNESAELDRKILDLADRINKKRMTQSQEKGLFFSHKVVVEWRELVIDEFTAEVYVISEFCIFWIFDHIS